MTVFTSVATNGRTENSDAINGHLRRTLPLLMEGHVKVGTAIGQANHVWGRAVG
ncbi:MAG: hypothetical protein KUG52_02655 [Immundisolibacteraceae bacterium]|nr:hypothetical protein [Immundisolibacteraceae bacterium]